MTVTRFPSVPLARPLGHLQQALIRMLAGAPDGLTSANLAPRATTQATLQRRQALVNTVLNRLRERGFVTRAGMVPGGWQQGQAIIWQLTEAGRRAMSATERA